ncbi:hypothetical protein MACJ_004090 [Theileria orientalis]|uniref:Uncharacterized protein n=1 Tax=Theileria orientalis TaxID=68886 RepID=A0A976SL03_THEOR|nr:hypothetical protein MACJ_004090 [Theileria orientalis]
MHPEAFEMWNHQIPRRARAKTATPKDRFKCEIQKNNYFEEYAIFTNLPYTLPTPKRSIPSNKDNKQPSI